MTISALRVRIVYLSAWGEEPEIKRAFQFLDSMQQRLVWLEIRQFLDAFGCLKAEKRLRQEMVV